MRDLLSLGGVVLALVAVVHGYLLTSYGSLDPCEAAYEREKLAMEDQGLMGSVVLLGMDAGEAIMGREVVVQVYRDEGVWSCYQSALF